MTVQRQRQDDVMGFLDERPIAVAVRMLFGGRPQRIVVQRAHVEKYEVKPDRPAHAELG